MRVVHGLQPLRAMKTVLMSLLVLAAAPRVARTDGWWEACDCNGDGQHNADAATIGASLGLAGIVTYGVGRKRKSR